jgi:hypothetical protein
VGPRCYLGLSGSKSKFCASQHAAVLNLESKHTCIRNAADLLPLTQNFLNSRHIIKVCVTFPVLALVANSFFAVPVQGSIRAQCHYWLLGLKYGFIPFKTQDAVKYPL